MLIERDLIEHCSPTLAGLKSAALFATKYSCSDELHSRLRALNRRFAEKGIEFIVVKQNEKTALIYVVRHDMLVVEMANPKASEILSDYGYGGMNIRQAIAKLSERLHSSEEFPHEIGLFLGYPPEDVEGFICNNGQNCHLCGYWKVYGDTDSALLKFAKYDKCRAVYKRLWAEGRDILRLTVKKTVVA